MHRYQDWIKAGQGERTADLVLKNAQVIDVFSGDIHESSVAIAAGMIVGFGDYQARAIIDLGGKYVCPGFIDGHIHLERSLVTPSEFAKIVVPLGTTSLVTDPCDIAVVLGLDGIRFMMEASRDLPLSFYFLIPCLSGFPEKETFGARLSSSDLKMVLHLDTVLGVSELPGVPGLFSGEKEALEIIRMAAHKRILGHALSVSGRALSARVIRGITSDHECAGLDEGLERLHHGMYLMIREGTGGQNLEQLLPLVNEYNSSRFMFVTDECSPDYLLEQGHINALVKKAIHLGLDPIKAIQLATINTAEYYHLSHVGAIAPGYAADLLVLDDLEEVSVEQVYKQGILAAEDGNLVGWDIPEHPPFVRGTINVHWLELEDLRIEAGRGKLRVIGVLPGQMLTQNLAFDPRVEEGMAIADPERDLAKIVVVERHSGRKNLALGFVTGFHLKQGALASSVSYNAHNIVALGMNDADILTALEEIMKMNGGQVVVRDGLVLTSLPLPVAGIMSDQPLDRVRAITDDLNAAARECGSIVPDSFLQMSFLTLPTIPSLRITNNGLVDVVRDQFTDLFIL